MALKLPTLPTNQQLVDENGNPTPVFQLWWQSVAKATEGAINGIALALEAAGIALDAADVALAAADAAQGAADTTLAENSIVNSFIPVGSFTGDSPIEADNAGNVTVKNHTRQYGDTTLNPNVAIIGSVVATGQVFPTIVRLYYDDATRLDTTPVFAFTIDPAPAPVQGGIRHVIGAVEIPSAGTSDGGFVRPPGYTDPIP